LVEAEREFEIEFADEDVERFRDVRDVVEFVSRSFFAI
jgi:acyl carrier protein